MEPVTQVYQYLDKQNKLEAEYVRKPSSRYRLSELGDCARRIKYRHEGTETQAVPGFVSLFGQDGDIAHDSVRWLMRKAGVELDGLHFNEETGEIKETMFCRKTIEHKGIPIDITGRADGMVRYDDEWMLLEIKSIDGWKSKYLNDAYNKGEFLSYLENGSSGKMAKFLDQCEAAMRCFNFDKTYLVMKDRSMCQIGSHDTKHDVREGFVLHRDDERWERIKNKLAMIEKAKADGTDLLRMTEGHWQCQQCPFSDKCWGE